MNLCWVHPEPAEPCPDERLVARHDRLCEVSLKSVGDFHGAQVRARQDDRLCAEIEHAIRGTFDQRNVGALKVEIPAYVALDYLVQELRAPIPATVLERLTAATMTVAPVERDVALLAARSRGGLRLRALLGGSATSRVKLTSLRWLLLPSPGYLQWAYGRPRLGILPLIYLERIARYFARRVRWRLDAARQRTGRSL